MRILFLTNLLPYPLDNGGKIKTYTSIKSFYEAGHELDILCFKELDENMTNEEAEMLLICNSINQVYLPLTTRTHKKYMINLAMKSIFSALPFSVYKYQSNEMMQKIRSKAQKMYDVIYFDHLPMCVYLNLTHMLWPKARFILDEHNCETIVTKRNARETHNLLKKIFLNLEAHKLQKFEATSIQNVDKTIVLSQIDYECLHRITNKKFNHTIIPIGVPDRGIKRDTEEDILNILFIGTLTWEPNNAGLIWFLKNVVPIIDSKKLKYHLYIVGKNPSEEVKKLSERYCSKITITGYVDSVDEYYNRCNCTIVPLFIGSGQRVKLIEAFSKGMPAISTTIGAEGLEYKNGESIVIADESESFANAIIEMNNADMRKKIGKNCREIYEKMYSPKIIAEHIVQAIN